MFYKLISVFFVFISVSVAASNLMRKTPVGMFVNGGEKDLSKLFSSPPNALLKSEVKQLFEDDKLNHEQTKAYDSKAVFETYWTNNQSKWNFIDLNKDGKKELIYQSVSSELNEMECVEIWILKIRKYDLLYKESGHLIAYKIHPNTKEILLFHYKYPCCSSASNTINMVRLVKGKIKLRKKYFLANDTGMKGDFFPKKVKFENQYSYLTKRTTLRWSPAVIMKHAWKLARENKVADYPKGTPYRVLARENGWKYVLMCGQPALQQNGIIQTANFMDVHVFGWIR